MSPPRRPEDTEIPSEALRKIGEHGTEINSLSEKLKVVEQFFENPVKFAEKLDESINKISTTQEKLRDHLLKNLENNSEVRAAVRRAAFGVLDNIFRWLLPILSAAISGLIVYYLTKK